MILYFRLSVCRLGKIIVIWTMLGGRAFMEQYLRHTKISFFFHVTSIIGVQTILIQRNLGKTGKKKQK
jgi:hypothetical protein